MSKKKTRQPVFMCVCGAPKHGKSFFAEEKIILMDRPTIIIDNSGREERWTKYRSISLRDKKECETFTGIRYTCVKWYKDEKGKVSPEEMFRLIDLHCNDMLIVFDDSRPYIGKHIGSSFHFMNLMTNRRQRGIGMININHSIAQIPIPFLDYIEILVLFYSADSPNAAAKRLNDNEQVKKPIMELKKIKASCKNDKDPKKYSKKILKLQ